LDRSPGELGDFMHFACFGWKGDLECDGRREVSVTLLLYARRFGRFEISRVLFGYGLPTFGLVVICI